MNGNVLKTIGDRKFSFEMANVVYGGGEVVFFLIAGWREEAIKKVAAEPLPCALGARLFYIMLLWLMTWLV